MNHLSSAEFVDLAEGTLPASRAAHVEGCATCQAQARLIGEALATAGAAADVPEPSPLFWDHLSARIREDVAATPQPSARAFAFGRLAQPVAAALAVGVVVTSAVMLTRAPREERAAPRAAVTVAPAAEPAVPPEPAVDSNHAAAWAVLTAAAEDLHFDDAREAGMTVPPAAVDQAVAELSRDELSELGRLLQTELKRSGD